MTTMIHSTRIDAELMTSQMFARVLQAYMECSDEIQEVIREMALIVNDPEASEDDRAMACSTIADALFPSRHGARSRPGAPPAKRHIHIELDPRVWAKLNRRLSDESRQLSPWLRELVLAELDRPREDRRGCD